MCLFIQSSLKEACKKWGVPKEYQKSDFEHEKVYDWESFNRHKEEMLDYLKFDVLSLAELYKIYNGMMIKAFDFEMAKAVSPSQHAIQCWLLMFSDEDFPEMYIPHTGKEENDFRSAYYGGRVTPQYKRYISEYYDNLEEGYDAIEKFLSYVDVNSLYPSAQHKYKYAYGKWKYVTGTQEHVTMLNLLSNKNLMQRSQFKVDVICPKDLLTPFLVSRNEKTQSMEHSLEDKFSVWYWGCELEEAVILGYEITKVHEFIEFEKLGDLFKKYVDVCWRGRKDNPKGGANANPTLNLVYKLMMNRLTGKFGQKSHSSNIAIFNTNYDQTDSTRKQFKELVTRINDFTPIFCSDGSIAILLDIAAEDANPSYPIDKSAQILAYSRVMMSQVMRIGNCYLDPRSAIYYTDTDSLVIPENVLPKLKAANLLGPELGQLSCDLHDWETEEDFEKLEFSKVIKAVWAGPKGPYSLVYVNPGEKVAKEKIRAKGIPHSKATFKYKEANKLEVEKGGQEEMRLTHMMLWLKRPDLYNIPSYLIGKQYYIFTPKEVTKETPIYYAKRLSIQLIEQMMARECTITCVFGTMRKAFVDRNGKVLEIRPDIVRRMPCKMDWWKIKALRYFKEEEEEEKKENEYALSYPNGYVEGRRTIDYEYEHLLRSAQCTQNH